MGIFSRTKDEYNKRRDTHKGIFNKAYAGAAAVPAAGHSMVKDYVVRPATAVRESNYVTLSFVIFAMVINFLIESDRFLFFFPGLGMAPFNGISLDFFKSTILSGDLVGIYNIFHFNIFFLLIIFAIINLRDGRPHILRVWLSLILVFYLLSAIPMLNTYMGVRTVWEFFMLFGSALYFSFSDVTKEDFISSIVVWWVLYNLLMFGVANIWSVAQLHFIFLIVFYITFCHGKAFKEDRIRIKWWLLIIILFDFFLPEMLTKAFPTFPIATLPFLTFGTLIFAQVYQPNKITTFFIIWFVIFYFLSFSQMGEAFQQNLKQRFGTSEDANQRGDIFSIKHIINMWHDWRNKTIYYASGQDYYASQVDTNSKKQLGVFLEDLEGNPDKFYDNEQVVVDATLSAQNLEYDEEDYYFKPVKIGLSCSAYRKGEEVEKGMVYPQSTYTVETYDVENIQCIFEPGQLEKGSYDIKFKAEFNFETQAYLKRYFVLEETLSSLRRNKKIKEDTDILDLNKIIDTNPIAKNSFAPVQIETSDNIPIILKVNHDTVSKQLFGIKLKNAWKGKIAKIKDVRFFIPDSISMDYIMCDPLHMELEPTIEGDQYKDYKMFSLLNVVNPRTRDQDNFIEQKCWIDIQPTDLDLLLQPGEVTTRYFLIQADYDYVLEEGRTFEIVEPDYLNVVLTSISNSPIYSDSDVKCIIKDQQTILSAKASIYNRGGNEYNLIDSKDATCVNNECLAKFSNLNKNKGDTLKCEVDVKQNIDDEEVKEKAIGYATVKNSLPSIREVKFAQNNPKKGDIVRCEASTSDKDDEDVKVVFSFEGLDIASVEKDCRNGCFVDVPTDSATENSNKLTCIATAYNEDATQMIKGEQKSVDIDIQVVT